MEMSMQTTKKNGQPPLIPSENHLELEIGKKPSKSLSIQEGI